MKKIILALSLIFAIQSLAQGSITFYGESAFNLAQEITESANFSCDLNPVNPNCVIETKVIMGKGGRAIFSGDVAADLQQVEDLEWIKCRTFKNQETFCQVDPSEQVIFDEGEFGDEQQKVIRPRGFKVSVK